MKNDLITSNGSFSCEEIVSSLRGEVDFLVGTNIYPEYLIGVSHLFDYTYLIPSPMSKIIFQSFCVSAASIVFNIYSLSLILKWTFCQSIERLLPDRE